MILGCICCGVGEVAVGSFLIGLIAVWIRRFKRWRCKCKCHEVPKIPKIESPPEILPPEYPYNCKMDGDNCTVLFHFDDDDDDD